MMEMKTIRKMEIEMLTFMTYEWSHAVATVVMGINLNKRKCILVSTENQTDFRETDNGCVCEYFKHRINPLNILTLSSTQMQIVDS